MTDPKVEVKPGCQHASFRSRVNPMAFDRARHRRRNSTPAERALWAAVRGHKLGIGFRREHVILGFIANFYCPAARLVVEIDGESHAGREEYDRRRAQAMGRVGIKTIRFTNEEVLSNLPGVLRWIEANL